MCKDGSWGGGYYICAQYKQMGSCQRNSYRRLHLEQEVVAYVFSVLRSQDIFDRVRLGQENDNIGELENQRQRLEKLIAGQPERRSRLFDLYEKGDISREEFLQRKAEHVALESQHTTALTETQSSLARMTGQQVTRESFENALKTLEDHWESCDVANRKQKLFSLIEKIVIKDRAFQVYFYMSPTREYGRELKGTDHLKDRKAHR